jgi:colanic acid biosynthesis glycosyl transferase WcaI
MRIGIVSQWYAPEPVLIPTNLADELAARGHDVRVLTGFPNYPTGQLYPGYRQRWRHTTESGGVTTRRVPLYASHDASSVRRAANYLSFAATSTIAAPRFLADVDVLYVYLTPATVYAAPALLRRTPTVVHVQDIWPESVTASSMAPRGAAGRAAAKVLHTMMRKVYAHATAIAVIAPSMRDLVVARGADPAKVRVVLNWADETLFHPAPPTEEARTELGHRGRPTILYAGAMGPFQNLLDSVRAANAVPEIDLVLVGSGIEEEAARALTAELGASNIRFLGRRPPSRIAALAAAADFQLVTLRDLPIFRGTIPSKLQAALACGSPVVVAAPGDSAELVELAGAGLACPPEDWRALADRFRQAAATDAAQRAEMGRRARATYETRMAKRNGVDELERLLAVSGSAR